MGWVRIKELWSPGSGKLPEGESHSPGSGSPNWGAAVPRALGSSVMGSLIPRDPGAGEPRFPVLWGPGVGWAGRAAAPE